MKTARWIKYILAALLAVSCFVSMTACSFGSDISKKMMIQGIGIDKEEEGYLVSVRMKKLKWILYNLKVLPYTKHYKI